MTARFALASLVSLLFAAASAQAATPADAVIQAQASARAMMLNTRTLIDWKVGDTASYGMSAAGMGAVGTMVETAEKEEGNGIWLKEETHMQSQNDVAEMLIDRDSAKVLKFIHNGQEQAPPADDIKIISQDYTSVTVPAGTFKCVHVVASSSQIKKIEVWANPAQTVLEGNLKQVASTGFIDITIEMTSFKKN